MRIGQGYDCHRFTAGDHIMLGGIKIPYDQGIDAHSDGDVLLHALTDALLGALALGDIGQHFPDSDMTHHNKSSDEFVRHAVALVKEQGYRINNVDMTVIAEAPRLASFIADMRRHVATLLELPDTAVSVKATTNEKMGWLGRGEGLAAQAVVLCVHE